MVLQTSWPMGCWVQVVMRYDGVGTPITALTVTPEGCVLAGTSKGALIMYSPIMKPQAAAPHPPPLSMGLLSVLSPQACPQY